MEVVPTGKNTFSKPIQLTSKNYMLPYDKIVAGETVDHPTEMEPVVPPRSEVKPDVIVPGKSAKMTIHELSDTIRGNSEVEKIPVQIPAESDLKIPTPSEAQEDAEQNSPIMQELTEESLKEEGQKLDEEIAESLTEENTPIGESSNKSPEEEASESAEETPADTESETPELIPNPYAGMTKKERKEARRAEREAAAKANTNN